MTAYSGPHIFPRFRPCTDETLQIRTQIIGTHMYKGNFVISFLVQEDSKH